MKRSILFLLTLTACAAPYRKPCSVQLIMTLAGIDDVDAICRDGGVTRWDDGRPVRSDQKVRGCLLGGTADAMVHIVIPEAGGTLFHEIRHLWDRYCR